MEIRISEVLNDNDVVRIDPEYFQKNDLSQLHRLKALQSCRVGEFAYVTDGIHESIMFSDDSEINLISAKCPKENYFELDSCFYISEEQHKANSRTSLRKGDIILSTVGTIGNCAVVDDSILPANSDRHVGIIRLEKDYLPYFLSTYLLSRYGRFQTRRETTGNVQPNLFLVKLRELLVPPFSMKFQKEVDSTVINAHKKLSDSKNAYSQAEQTLLRAIGLEGWQPPETLTYERKASEVFSAGRFDAEHFQPKFDSLLNSINSTGLETLRLDEIILPIKNGYDCREFVEEGTPYIRVGDIKNGRICIESAVHIPLSVREIDKDISLEVGDVLFTRKGSFGNAAPVWEETKKVVISSEIMLLRRRKKYKNVILPEYLSLFFNSIAGSLQAEKWAHGVAFYSITQDDMGCFVIPILPLSQQENLCSLLDQAEAARKQAHVLLECAKRAVEIAIEENEKAGLSFLQKIKDISIS